MKTSGNEMYAAAIRKFMSENGKKGFASLSKGRTPSEVMKEVRRAGLKKKKPRKAKKKSVDNPS